MELVQYFVFTASVALVLSFIVAKLLSLATSDRPSPPPEFNSTDTDEVREMLKVQEAYQIKTKLEKPAGQVKEVDRFHVAEEVSVEKATGVECRRGEVEEEISESGQVEGDVDCGKEAEGKMGNYSDEDDWEGIEKSEVDEGYTAAVKSEEDDEIDNDSYQKVRPLLLN